jgi:outer membrane protein assembly factor BamB
MTLFLLQTDLTINGGVAYSGSADVSGKYSMAFDAFTGKTRWVLDWQDNNCTAMIVDATRVFSSRGSTVFAIEKETGQQRFTFTAGRKIVRAMCYSRTRRLLFVSSADGTVRAIDENGRECWCFAGHAAGAEARVLYLSETEHMLFSGARDCTVRALAVDRDCGGQPRERWCHHDNNSAVTTLTGYKVNGTHVVFIGGLFVHAVVAGNCQPFWEEPFGPLGGEVSTMIVCDPGEGPTVIIGSRDKTIQAIDAVNGQALWAVDEPCGAVVNVSFASKLVYTCSALRDVGKPLAKIRALDAYSGKEKYEKGFKIAPTAIHHTKVVGIDHVIVGFEDGNLRVLSKQLQQIIEVPGQHTEAINHLLSDAEWLWSASTGPVVMTRLKPLCHNSMVLSGRLHDRTTKRGKLDHLRNHLLPRVDFVLRAILMVLTVMQLMALVVNHPTVHTSDDFRVAIDWIRELNLQSGTKGIGRMLIIYLVTNIIVITFIVAVVFQEMLEWQEFIHPESSTWELLWLGVSFFCQVCALKVAVVSAP